MKSVLLFLAAVCCIPGSGLRAQAVPKAVIVEHFTNSYCSVCGSRNPGLYQNLSQHPGVLHIAYYPSAPYPACPFNQYNKAEADARTNFYGVYGSTPRLAIQGAAISANANYSDAAILRDELGQTTPFALSLRLSMRAPGTAEAQLVVTKVDTSALDSALVYAAVVEDTVAYSSRNGEQLHHDVFRRSVWGTQALPIRLPVATGDSIVLTQTFAADNSWPQNRMYGIAMLQQASGRMLQASRSNNLALGAATTVPATPAAPFAIYPNPSVDLIHVQGIAANTTAIVHDLQGRAVLHVTTGAASTIDLRSLAPGSYILSLDNHNVHFVKQ